MSSRAILSCLLLAAIPTSCSRDPNVLKVRYLQNGNKYFEKGKYKQAAILYRTALQKDARFGEAYYRLALTELKLEQPLAAAGLLRKAVETLPPAQPERTDARIKLADLELDYLERSPRREKEVVDEVQRIAGDRTKEDPKSPEGHRLQGRFFFVVAQEALSKHDTAKMNQALHSAIAEFRAANSVSPDQTNVVLGLARSLTANQQLGEAQELYRGLLERDRENLQAYSELYRIYMFQNQPGEAEAILKKAVENNPKKYELLINLAQHYYRLKRGDDVTRVLQSLKSHAEDYPQAYEQAGAFYFRIGDGAEAMRQYEDGIQANPARKTYYQKRIIEVLLVQGKREEVRKINESILTANPKDTDALALQAELMLDMGDFRNAVTQLQAVVRQAPGNFVAHYDLGRGLAQKGEVEQARAQFKEALRLRPDYMGARLALAETQLSTHEFGPAIRTANEALAYDPNNPRAHLIRASAYMGSNQVGRAKAELKQVLDQVPNSQDAMISMGLVLAAEKKFQEAEAIFRKSYDLNPADVTGLLGMTEAMIAQNQPDRAVRVLRSEIQKFPARTEIRQALANLYARAGKLDLAIAEFNALLDKVDRKSAEAADIYFRLAETQKLARNIPAAIDAMQKAHEAAPDNVTILNKLAAMLSTAGRKKEAKAAYENVLRIDSGNAFALNNLAYLIAESPEGDLNQALTFAQRANQKQPQAHEIADTLGLIYLKKNLPDNALEIFKNNVTKAPKNPLYRYHLAMALYQKGDKEQARQELQTALANGPSKEEAASIRELIGKI